METTWQRKEYETWDDAFRALSPVIRQQSVRVASYTQVLFVAACSTSFGKDTAQGAEQMKAKYAELSYKCGLYHQLGKALVPTEYQIWQNDFTEEEQAVYKKYTTDGRRLVARLQEKTQRTIFKRGKTTDDAGSFNVTWNMIRESCEQHMERFDGSGFPSGKSGNEISPIAQIVGIAKELDMLASTRRSEDPFSEAYDEIVASAGVAFSEELVAVLKKAREDCREVYRKYINYTLTIPKTIPLVNKHREKRPMGITYYNTFDPTANRVRSYEAIPWFKGLEDDSETTEGVRDVEPMLQRLEMLDKMAFFLLYEAADTVLRIETCKLPIDAVILEMFPSFYNKSYMGRIEKLFSDQPIDRSRLLLTVPASVVKDADDVTLATVKEYLSAGVALLLDDWTPEDVSVTDAVEMGFINVRPHSSMYLKRESAELIGELHGKGFAVFAKGIEDDDARRWLTACSVKHISGPVFSHAVTEDELIKEALLRERAYE